MLIRICNLPTVLPSISKIFLGGVAKTFEAEYALKELFQQYGIVKDFVLMKDKATGLPRGFGFVVMESAADETAVIDALHGTEFMGST